MLAPVRIALLGDVHRVVKSGEHGIPRSRPEILPNRKGHERNSWRSLVVRVTENSNSSQPENSPAYQCREGDFNTRKSGRMSHPVHFMVGSSREVGRERNAFPGR